MAVAATAAVAVVLALQLIVPLSPNSSLRRTAPQTKLAVLPATLPWMNTSNNYRTRIRTRIRIRIRIRTLATVTVPVTVTAQPTTTLRTCNLRQERRVTVFRFKDGAAQTHPTLQVIMELLAVAAVLKVVVIRPKVVVDVAVPAI